MCVYYDSLLSKCQKHLGHVSLSFGESVLPLLNLNLALQHLLGWLTWSAIKCLIHENRWNLMKKNEKWRKEEWNETQILILSNGFVFIMMLSSNRFLFVSLHWLNSPYEIDPIDIDKKIIESKEKTNIAIFWPIGAWILLHCQRFILQFLHLCSIFYFTLSF